MQCYIAEIPLLKSSHGSKEREKSDIAPHIPTIFLFSSFLAKCWISPKWRFALFHNSRIKKWGGGGEKDWKFFNITSDDMAATDHQWDYANTPEAILPDKKRAVWCGAFFANYYKRFFHALIYFHIMMPCSFDYLIYPYYQWIIPGYEYIYVECENDDTFPKVIEYMKVNDIPLAGAVHDFICPLILFGQMLNLSKMKICVIP